MRYTQKFGEYFDASLAVESPQNGRWNLNVNSANPLEGETGEVPMVEGKLRYEQDLYGKAGWYGKPRGFYVGLGGGWFLTRSAFATNPYAGGYFTFGQQNYFAPAIGANLTVPNSYQNHWLALIENFTPIIPTTTKSLAGTMSLAQQWWIGQGVSAWRADLPANDRYYTYNGGANVAGNPLSYTQSFIKRYGGWLQLQYYWTEEIYTNINGGFEQAFGFTGNKTNNFLATAAGTGFTGQPGFVYLNGAGIDPINNSFRVGITQWYRPVAAVKFALQYSYFQNNFFQYTTVGTNTTNKGNCHTIFANAWYLF